MIIKFLASGYSIKTAELYEHFLVTSHAPDSKRKQQFNPKWSHTLKKTQSHLLVHYSLLFVSSISKGSWTAKIFLFLSGFFRWNSTSQKVPLSIEIELWGRVSKTVLMSYSEKSPGYLAQMQNWPSVWPKNSWGAGDGQQQQTFSFLLWDILGFDYGVIKEFNFNVTFSYSSKSKQKIWTTKLRKTLLKFFWLENFTEKKSLGTIHCKDEVLTQFWWYKSCSFCSYRDFIHFSNWSQPHWLLGNGLFSANTAIEI